VSRPPPQPDSDAIRFREQREAERLASMGGSSGEVKTDLDPEELRGERRVLLGV
jgi:hypothetical protein